jgi:hypothetical protein
MAINDNIKEGVDLMNNAATVQVKKIGCMNSIRNIAKRAIKEKGLSDYEIRKTLGSKRYEK